MLQIASRLPPFLCLFFPPSLFLPHYLSAYISPSPSLFPLFLTDICRVKGKGHGTRSLRLAAYSQLAGGQDTDRHTSIHTHANARDTTSRHIDIQSHTIRAIFPDHGV